MTLSVQEAERLVGDRLDRRRRYALGPDGKVGVIEHWTVGCSGCIDTEDGIPIGDYEWDAKHKCYIGAGCPECGYTGKRRMSFVSPLCRN